MSNIDRAATRERCFLSPKSKVMRDGREILGKKDWDIRKRELWNRAGGRCEYEQNVGGLVYRCRDEGVIPAHVIPRKDITQRDDRLSNLKLYCLEHDRLTEKQSWRRPQWTQREPASRKVEA